MLDIGFQELAVIMVLALLIFGPDKLPDLGRRLGRAMREFRRASDEFRSTVEQNLQINADISPVSLEPTPPAATAVPDAPGADSPASEPAGIAVEAAPEGQRPGSRWSPSGPVGEGVSSTGGSAHGGAAPPSRSGSR